MKKCQKEKHFEKMSTFFVKNPNFSKMSTFFLSKIQILVKCQKKNILKKCQHFLSKIKILVKCQNISVTNLNLEKLSTIFVNNSQKMSKVFFAEIFAIFNS